MRYRMASLFVFVLISASLSMGGCASTEIGLSSGGQSYRAKNIAVINISEGKDPTIWDGWTIRWDSSESEEMAACIQRAMMNSGLYTVADPAALEQAIAKEKLSKAALGEPETAARVAKLAGLDGIVLVRSEGYTHTVLLLSYYISKATTVRMIDAETAREVWSAEVGFTDMGFFPIMPSTMIFTSAETRMAKDLKDELRSKILSGDAVPRDAGPAGN